MNVLSHFVVLGCRRAVVCRLLSLSFAAWWLLALSGCREESAYMHFASTDRRAWTRADSAIFVIDSVSEARDYPLSVLLRTTSADAYPYRSVTLAVRQVWSLPVPDAAAQARANRNKHFVAIGQPRPKPCLRDSVLFVRTDTLTAGVAADEKTLRARGVAIHSHAFPLVTLRLPAGAKGRVTVSHLMRREALPGFESVGILLR